MTAPMPHLFPQLSSFTNRMVYPIDMAAKKKSPVDNQARGMTKDGKVVQWGDPKKYKSSEAVVTSGQKAKDLKPATSKDRFKPEFSKNIPTSNRAVDVLNATGRLAAETVALGGAGAIISTAGRSIAKKAGIKAFEKTGGAAFQAGMERLAGATGKGGKVSRTFTPMGQTLRSTTIGTKAQQSARMNNLAISAEKQAIRAGRIEQRRAVVKALKATQKVNQVALNTGGIAAIQQAKQAVNKGRNKRK